MNSKEKIIVGVDSGDYETSIYWVKKERHEVIKHEPLELIEWFEKHTNMNLVFAVETIENVFIKSAISEGFSVFATTPFQSKNMRGVDSISGKKDDRYDAKVHGEFYRDRPDVFRKTLLNLLRHSFLGVCVCRKKKQDSKIKFVPC